MSTYITASACQEATPKTPTPDSPSDRGKICRPARDAGILPSRRFGIWFTLAAAVLGFAVPSEAGVRTTFVDASPSRNIPGPTIRIGQTMGFKGRLVSSNGPVANARVSIHLDGSPSPTWVATTRRDGSFDVSPKAITHALLRSPVPPQGRKVVWEAEFKGMGNYWGTGLRGKLHNWGFWLMPSSIALNPTAPQSTPSGLIFEVLQAGAGVRPVASSTVKMHYHCYLPNGTVIDSSVLRGQPFTAALNQMIKGLSEGLLLMRAGSKYRFTVPGSLAYGQNGVPPAIGPNQTLMFDIQLLEVIN